MPGERLDTSRYASLRVLVVDDCPDTIAILDLLFCRLGCEVYVACTAITAIEVAAKFMPQIGLLDIAMPGCDGYCLASQLRSVHGLETLPLIAVTACADKAHKDRAAEVGIDAYVVKPFAFDGLKEVIEQVLHGR